MADIFPKLMRYKYRDPTHSVNPKQININKTASRYMMIKLLKIKKKKKKRKDLERNQRKTSHYIKKNNYLNECKFLTANDLRSQRKEVNQI